MLIQALCSYYDVLEKRGKIVPEGWSVVDVTYLVYLTSEGKIAGIQDWRDTVTTTDKKGKVKETLVKRSILLPKRSEKPGIDSSIIEHRPLSLFGINYDPKSEDEYSDDDKTHKAQKSRQVFEEKNLEFLEGIDSPVVNAYRNFITTWKPHDELENEHIRGLGKMYPASYYAFCLEGRPDLLLHEDQQLKEKWNRQFAEPADDGEAMAQCCITGEKEPVARLHEKIKGLPNPGTGGNILVCFNNASENSYGREQSYNSNISKTAMHKYTAALNYLLRDRNHRDVIDDICVIHWAETGDEQYDDIFAALSFGDTKNDAETDKLLKSIVSRMRDGWTGPADIEGIGRIDPACDYYIAGLKTNSSRVAIKFVYKSRFGDIIKNLMQHQTDMKVRADERPVAIWQINRELISPKSKKETLDPSLFSGMMGSVICGRRYPAFLLTEAIRRVKTDSDEEKNSFIKLNDVRIGIIKACINRNLRSSGKKEEIKMALDKENRDPAYVCGRLFAVLESIQYKAAGCNLNRTIRDAYFSSAASRPASVFPVIMKLSMHHMAKLGNPKYFSDAVQELVGMLNAEFPATLNLANQGKFIIGYYQQRQFDFENMKKNKEEK